MKDKRLFMTVIMWVLYVLWLLFFASVQLTIGNVIGHLLFLVIIVILNFEELKSEYEKFKTDKKKISKILLYALGLFVVMQVGNVIVSIISEAYEVDSSSQTIFSLFEIVPLGTMFVAFTMIMFYPVVEELIFRKSLKAIITNNVFFVIFSSLIIWYFQVTLINPNISEFIFSFPTFLVMLYLSFIYVKKNNIIYTITTRIIYNVVILIIQVIGLILR